MLNTDFQLVEQLFRQYYKILRAYAFRLVNDRNAAEDIVQDVFVALWNRRTELHTDGTIKSYLFKAVYNKSLNYLNSKKYTEEDSLELFIDRLNTLQTQDGNQENLFLVKELQKEIENFTHTLPRQVKRVFILSRARGLKIPEIAHEMELSHKTVEKYLSKALAELRIYLKDKDLLGILVFIAYSQNNFL